MGHAESDPQAQSEITAFRQGLQKLGWTGRNVRIAYRYGDGEVSRMRTFAKELIALQPDAVLAVTTPAVKALEGETRTIPIVFVRVGDPFGDGLVDNAAKPSGNVTGFTTLEPSIAGKWLQLLKEIAPGIARVTFMFNPATAPYRGGLGFLQITEAAALSAGVKVNAARVHDVADIERVIATVASEGNGGLISAPDVFLSVHRDLTIELAARYRVPTIYQYSAPQRRHCPKAPPECINRPANAFWHLCIFPPQAGLCSACFAKLYVAAIKPPVGELTYLVELSGGLPTTTLRQGEKTTTSGYLARQSCAYDRT